MLCAIMINFNMGEKLRLTEGQVWLFILASLASLLGSMTPALVNKHTTHAWYAAFVLGLSFFIASSDSQSAERVWRYSCALVPLRMMLSLNYSRLAVVLVLNSVYAIAAVHAIATARSSGSASHFDEDVRMREVILTECLALFAITHLSRTAAASLWSETFHQTQVASLQGESSAMSNLLDVMCEVVVELDGDQRIAEHSHKFAAMLALNQDADTKSAPLQDFLPLEEEKRKVEDMLSAMSRNTRGAMPGLAHVTLRDSYGMRLRAELFCVHFRGLDKSSRYYVGIQESRDLPAMQMKSRAGQSNMAAGTVDANGPPGDPDTWSLGDSPRGDLLHANFEPTPQQCEAMHLMSTVMAWNFRVPRGKCCAFHAAWDEVIKVVKPFSEGPCKMSFRPTMTVQCSNCHILDRWEDVGDSLECQCCGEQLMKRPQLSL
eukprot:TRINITY_DN15491_c0_g1_i1.p1 TRINITY_DN15491_c0_g1~~TRINITY_DN15491_c0_g1_i1.p1  ORF type:complete len:433 (-),score=69.76 TRINITY_DN15491_c0_g1_i1:122-1420(-)